MSYQCYLLFTPFVLQEVHVLSMLFVIIYSICFAGHVLSMLFVIIYSICFAGHVLSMLFVIIYSICFAGGSCLINVICYYLLQLFCRRFMSYQCYLLLFTPFVLQEVHVLSMLFVIIYSICFAGGSCLINVICYYLLHLFCRSCLIMSYQCYQCYYLLHLFCRRFMSYQCYLLLFTPFVLQVMSYQCYLLLFTPFVLQVMSYQCYLLLFTPFVLQEVHVLSMLFVSIYSICFAGGSCLINVICYYLLHLFCSRFMSYQCYLLLFTPFVLQVMSYQCYLLLFSFVLQVMSYQCYLLLFTPFVLQEVHVLSMLFVIIYSNCFAGHVLSMLFVVFTPFVLQEVHVLSMLFVIIYSICFAGGSCLINVICYYLLHLFSRRFMSYQCYLLFTPFVLQELHVLSMLFVIIYSICFAGGSCLINVICYYLLHLFCRRFMSYQCYLLLFTPFVLQEVHVLSMLFVIIYSICFAGHVLSMLFVIIYSNCFAGHVLSMLGFAGHVLSMLFVIIYSICFAGGSCIINVICYYYTSITSHWLKLNHMI